MKALLLNLRGPLRSWGVESLGDDRWTEMRPTSSAIVGLLGACAGINRNNKTLMDAWFQSWSVITASATSWSLKKRRMMPALRPDYQTASDSLKKDGTTNPYPVVTLRGYVELGRDCVAVVLRDTAEPVLYDLAVAGLQNPVYTPFLGRRCNPLSEPLLAPEGLLDEPDAGTIADKLLVALGTPGLMEEEVDIHEVELTANAGVLASWTRQQRNLGRQVMQMRQGVTDDRLSGAMTYAMRAVDVVRFKLEAEETVE